MTSERAIEDAFSLRDYATKLAQTLVAKSPKRHVVLSTKMKAPWFYFAVLLKVILEMLGCSVYNPNTDNAAQYKDEANDRWLRTFNRFRNSGYIS